jgi:hypothetical protein
MGIMADISEARANRDEFIERVNAEFGGVKDWEQMKREIIEKTCADSVNIQADVLATKLAREGYLVKPYIGRTRFTARLRPEDVGLDPQDPAHKEFVRQYMRLGSKHLIPLELLRKLDRIESRIRKCINEKYGIPTVQGAFVPYKNLEPMKEEVERLKAEYYAIRDEILSRYDQLYQETELAYREFAVEVYQLLHKDPGYMPSEEEIEQFVTQTMKSFPARKTIEQSFRIEINLGIVMFTAFLAEQEARLRLVRERERQFQEELALIERQLGEESRVQAERERQRLLVEREKAKTALMEEQMKQKAISEAIAQAREKYLPQMEQVFADLAGAVHGIVYDAVTRVTEALQTSGHLTGGSVKALNNLIEKVRTLALTPDPDVERWIKQIQGIIDTPSEKRDFYAVRNALDGIRAEAARVILDIGRVPRTLRNARNIELPDIENALKNIEIRKARSGEQLRIDLPEENGETTRPLVRALRTA